MEEEEQNNTLEEEMGSYYHLYEYWKTVRSYQGTQARMPYELKIQ
jgi:protease-4